MPTCFLCTTVTTSVINLFKHFDYFHSSHEFSFYRCVDGGCSRSFHLKNTFRKHLKTQHQRNDESSSSLNSVSDIPSICHQSESLSTVQPQQLVPCSVTSHATLFKPVSSDSLSIFISSLYANPLLPRNAVQSVVDGLRNYMQEGLGHDIINIFDEMLTSLQNGQDITSFKNRFLLAVQSPLETMKTEHLRLQHLCVRGTYIPPTQITIGQKMITVRKQGTVTVQPFKCIEQLIPLRKVLQMFFSLEGVMTETLNYINFLSLMTEKGLIENFIQGSFWVTRKKKHGNKMVFPLFMFFDDYESGNVLGSHSGIHKLGAVYVSVACMPPHRASSLTNIFLALLFHSSDRNNFGNGVIFQPLIEEFNFLLEYGVEINTASFKGKLYFELALILGDNLGIHSIIGFNESFSSNFPCRICNVSKEVMKEQCYEDENLYRNADQYEIHLAENNSSNTGIKEKCVWLAVKGFSLFEQVGVDVMHDILEGTAKYVMSFLIAKYVTDLKYFSIQLLNDKISSFDYGPDTSSKPCILNMAHIANGNVKLSASEMLTFIRYFSLIIGEFVPYQDPYWKLYISLRKLIDLVTCQKITETTSDVLRCLVGELNELYLELTNQSLKPKFHFLTHYHALMKKFGPLINIWGMRFEAKHRTSKVAARASFNRRNITLTLAIKHQLQLNDIFLTGHLAEPISTGPVKSILNSKCREIITALNLSSQEPLKRVSWAKINGTLFKSKSILFEDIIDLEGISFMCIKNIYVYSTRRVIFECTKFVTLDFDEHFHSYHVDTTTNVNIIFVFYNSLICHVPNHLNLCSNGNTYITLRAQL